MTPLRHPLLSLHCGDALQWLHRLKDNTVDLWITSPPYADCRTYGLNRREVRRGESWVEWYIPYCVEMARTGRLVAVNAVGPVRNGKYSPIIEWLISDLTRRHGLVIGPAPFAWVKSCGTPGSGQKCYQRRDWEPVYVFGRPENFPPAWSNNTAFGHAPKWAPGGEFSNRMSDGKRVNQWGSNGHPKTRRRDGQRQLRTKPLVLNSKRSYKAMTAAQPNGRMEVQHYRPPAIANPGNVIRTGNGGNQCGHKLAHESEAPMNLIVAERFVRWYCPPGGLVGDPMCGSGTSGHAAIKWNRCFLGCDIREVQIELSRRRLASVMLEGE